jgi:DNA-binding NarL/FixJ family response regulator
MKPIRTLLADDHTLFRAGLRALLKEIEGVVVIAEAENGREAVTLAKAKHPDLVVMDISMPELNGVDATAQIRKESPNAQVLILSMHNTESYVRGALMAGASGYLVKDAGPLELRMAVEAVMRGERYISSRVSKHLVAGLVNGRAGPGESPLDSLTARQRETLRMIAEGKSTRQIALAMEVGVKTVESHRAALMARLGIHDVAGLVLYAVRHDLITADRSER